MVNQYKYKFYINANHAIFINNKLGQIHPHTWEITIDVLNINENFIQFDKIEKIINKLFDKYQDQLINNIEPFNKINPTLENIVFYFKTLIQSTLKEYKLILLSIEISETPSRAYIINLYDEVDINILNINKMQNDEDSLIEQIVLANKKNIKEDASKENVEKPVLQKTVVVQNPKQKITITSKPKRRKTKTNVVKNRKKTLSDIIKNIKEKIR